MVRRSPEHYIHDDFFFSSSGSSTGSGTSRGKRLTAGLFNSVSALVASCSKQASRVSRKLRSKQNQSRIEPKSPLARPKQLLTNISNKKIPFLQRKKGGEEREGGEGAEKGFGEGGVWQRAILMGDKCEPLDYSGVIYYNSKGEQVQDIPMRSPRASPLPRYAAGR